MGGRAGGWAGSVGGGPAEDAGSAGDTRRAALKPHPAHLSWKPSKLLQVQRGSGSAAQFTLLPLARVTGQCTCHLS